MPRGRAKSYSGGSIKEVLYVEWNITSKNGCWLALLLNADTKRQYYVLKPISFLKDKTNQAQ